MARSYGQIMSQHHEARLAKKFDGHTQPASGAFWSRKGDVQTEDMLIEHKWTGKDRFTIKADVLHKICREAVLAGRVPVLGISLGGKDYVVLEEADFTTLVEKARAYEALQG